MCQLHNNFKFHEVATHKTCVIADAIAVAGRTSGASCSIDWSVRISPQQRDDHKCVVLAPRCLETCSWLG